MHNKLMLKYFGEEIQVVSIELDQEECVVAIAVIGNRGRKEEDSALDCLCCLLDGAH